MPSTMQVLGLMFVSTWLICGLLAQTMIAGIKQDNKRFRVIAINLLLGPVGLITLLLLPTEGHRSHV